jgi:diguanylate cyclase (GGDEF)-like protein
MCSIVVLAYRHQTDRFNKNLLENTLVNMVARIKDQQLTWAGDSDHMLSVLEWSGLLNLPEVQQQSKLLGFFTVQAASMEVDGVVITDKYNGRLLFNYWTNFEHPRIEKAFSANQTLWYDEQRSILYTINKRDAQAPGFNGLNIYFFKAWDSALLNRLNYPEATTYLSLAKQTLLSSAGTLAIQDFQNDPQKFERHGSFYKNNVSYLQDSIALDEVLLQDGNKIPVTLTMRTPEQSNLPIHLILASALAFIIVFGMMLFLIFGRWLSRLGNRLDGLSRAAISFHSEEKVIVSGNTNQMLLQADAGKNDQISLLAQELTVLMESASERDEEQRTYLQTLDLLQDAVIEFEPTGRIIHATAAWYNMTCAADLTNCGLEDCIHPDDVDNVMGQLSALTHEQKQQVNFRFRMCRLLDTNTHYWVEGRFAAIKLNDKVVSIRGVVRDITNTYQQEKQISHMALHDALTDLPNRVLLEDRMEMAISRAERTGKRVALGFIDLDHFKQVNDNFGHKIGDLMLKEVTSLLTAALRTSDTLSRWGGDEFVVLCPDLESLADARDITEKLASLSQKNILIEGTELPFIFSAGFAVYPDDASDSETLLAQADRAMFYAKAQGRNNIQFFNTIAGKESGRQSFYIQSRLSKAISNNQIKAWLQPLISAQTGRAIGAEVLARWHEAEQGWISPAVFIPMAESLGMIGQLGQSVWQQALQAFSVLPHDHRLSINLSKRQLFSNTIVQQFCDDVARANISTDRIMLEITEGIALSDVAFARERIVELDKQGFGIAVDDFGVGYSSLSQLHEIPVDELKLDIAFVRRIHEKNGFSMATAIISIAKSLNLECVAEGVEDAKTAELLTSMGVEILQGYYFSKPMPIDEYILWLAARDTKAEQP